MSRHPPAKLSLVSRVFLGNALVLTAAVGVLAFSPAQIPAPTTLAKALVVVGSLSAVLAVNFFLLRRALSPLGRLAEAMGRVEPLRPGERVPVYGNDPEVLGLTVAFNEMLERLEVERRQSVTRSLLAQEEERRRVARELHDEVGQSLTAVVLQLDRLSGNASDELSAEAADARETARASLEDVRRIAQRLRPEALDDLGLRTALSGLADQVSEQAAVTVRCELVADLPSLAAEHELVIYRVAQEALTNVLRHSGADVAELRLERDDDGVVLSISDAGTGVDGAPAGAGIQGMRERALLVGGRLELRSGSGGGTEVRLQLPVER